MTMLAGDESDDFQKWCDRHTVSECDVPAAFIRWMKETTGWDGRLPDEPR